MKVIKFIITLFFLVTSYWVTYLVFSRNFAHEGIKYSADNWNENTFMILLISTSLSAVGVFFLGILSMFTHFVFIKLIYSDEIKQAALFYLKNKKRENAEVLRFNAAVAYNESKSLTGFKKFKYNLKHLNIFQG